MHVHVLNLAVVLWLSGLALGARADGDDATLAPADTNVFLLHVAEVTLTEARDVRWGTNVVPVAAFTNAARDVLGADVEAVLIHGGLSDGATLRVPPELLEYLMRTGKNILVDTRDNAAVPAEGAAGGNIQSVTLKTSYLRIFEGRETPNPGGEKRLVDEVSLGSTIEVDTERGTYQLREVGLGLWDDRLWLVRGLPEDDADPGTIGVQFKKDW